MEYIFLIFIVLISFYSAVKYPGFILAYLLFFQNVNMLIFTNVGLEDFRYITSIITLSLISIYHFKHEDIKLILPFLLKNNIFKGFFLITFYIISYSLFLGTQYEFQYLQMFLFPGFILFLISSYSFTYLRFYKEFYVGIIFFCLFTSIVLLAFNGIEALSDRTFSLDGKNISAITQGRFAGMLFLFSSCILLFKKENIFFKIISFSLMAFAIFWATMTGTRGVIIAVILTGIFYLIFSKSKISFLSYIIFGSLLIIPLLFYFGFEESLLYTRFAETQELGKITRYKRFLIFFEFLPQYFLFGTGPGGWSKFIWGGYYSYPHNIFIEFFIEYGIIGLISFFMIFISSIRIAISVISKYHENLFIKPIVLGWIYFLICVMFSGGFVQGNDSFFTYCGIMIGVASYIKSNRFTNNL